MAELHDDSQARTQSQPLSAMAVSAAATQERMIGVHFATPVDGSDPDDGTPFLATRHRVRAVGMLPGVDETRFVGGTGEIVARWPTDVIEQVVWPGEPRPGGGITVEDQGATGRKPTMKDRYPRAGERWEDDEDDRLAGAFEAGVTIPAMARDHQRSPGAIRARLVLLGLLDPGPPPGPGARADNGQVRVATGA